MMRPFVIPSEARDLLLSVVQSEAKDLLFLAMLAVPCFASAAQAQTDSVRLGDLQTRAVANDPRGRSLELLRQQSSLRQQNLDAERLPSIGVNGQAQYQSDVARIPLALPGVTIPTPSKDTYDAHLSAQQKLHDPSVDSRRAVESAQLAESEARLLVALFPVRQRVNDAFFAALRSQLQVAELETTLTDLEAQRDNAARRVEEGTALPSEERILRAELLRRRQTVTELQSSRRAALDVLRELTGTSVSADVLLALPALDSMVARVTAEVRAPRFARGDKRPEYQQFMRTRELLERQIEARGAAEKPRISAFGRAGYGRPGLNPLNDKFDTYWLAGVQLQWSPFNWGGTDRDRELLSLQKQIVSAEEESFSLALRAGIQQDLAAIDRLAATTASDDEIIALRESILAEFRVRFAEGVVTASEFVDRQTDVLSARVARAIHRADLALANSKFLTTLGLEVR